MDTAVLIWIIIGIIVVALVVIGAVFLMRGRAEKQQRAQHEKAEKLRAQAREAELAAREGEARAAQTRADAASASAAAQQAQARAAQADLEAQRLADSVDEHEAEATKHRAQQEETLRKADEVDPFVTSGAGATRSADERAVSDADGDGRADAATDQRITRTPAEHPDTTAPAHQPPVIEDTPPTRREAADRT